MPAALIPRQIADDVFEFAVETPKEAQALARVLRQKEVAEDVVAGLSSVCVSFDPARYEEVHAALSTIPRAELPNDVKTQAIEIEIRYGGSAGPDFEALCTALDLTAEAFIQLHAKQMHTVEMIGFTPGFSYISGLPDTFKIPRLSDPRPRVPAGSVGISAAFTGIYALAGPGGWPLIGQTDTRLFDRSSETPFLLSPGQQVRFKAV